MSSRQPAAIIVESDSDAGDGIASSMAQDGYQVATYETAEDAIQSFRTEIPDIAVADSDLNGAGAIGLLQAFMEANPDGGFILMTNGMGGDTTVEALREGALGYVTKPINVDEVRALARNALRQKYLSEENQRLVEDLQNTNKELDTQVSERIRAEEAVQENLRHLEEAYERQSKYAEELSAEIERRRRIEGELASSEELRRLQVTEAVREDERRRLAEELHDDTMAALSAMGVDVSLLRRQAREVSEALNDDTLTDYFKKLESIHDQITYYAKDLADLFRDNQETHKALEESEENARQLELAYQQTQMFAQDFARQFQEAKKTQAELQYTEELRQLQAAEAAREDERKRLAEELHDDTMAALAAMGIDVSLMRREAKKVSTSLEEGLQMLGGLLKETDTRLRELVFGIFPSVLTNLGLVPALRSHFEQLTTRRIINPHPIEINYHTKDVESRRFKEEIEIGVYRFVQQAVTNTIQHAQASTVDVELTLVDNRIKVSVTDNGIGFDVANPNETPQTGHFGLVNLQDRLEALGGTFTIESKLGKGTSIGGEVPFEEEYDTGGEPKTFTYRLENEVEVAANV